MTILKIYALDDTEQLNILASLGIGEHVLGRGGILKITDQRVSRKHAVINVTQELVTLTSVHINPCFFKKANDNRLNIIRKDSNHELNDGDAFGLLPSEYWFTIGIQRNGKRPNDGNSEAKLAKLSKPNPSGASTSGLNEQSTIEIPAEQQPNEENDYNIVITNVRSLTTANDFGFVIDNVVGAADNLPEVKKEVENEVKVKTEPVDLPTTSAEALTAPIAPSAGASTAPIAPKKEKCWYGAACFRKNPNHRSQFSHPGDEDYVSEDENRPDCPFGASCYRKNPEHRREYKHGAGKPAPKPKNATLPKNSPPETPPDDFDYDDPFINDASSDDYQPSDGINSSDTDLEDFQEVAEESEEMRRTIAEAKKFTKRKK